MAWWLLSIVFPGQSQLLKDFHKRRRCADSLNYKCMFLLSTGTSVAFL
jgi:hypothetical protein